MVDVLLLLLEHKVTLVWFFKVTASDGVTGLIMGYWQCAANRACTQEKKQAFVSLGSREVSALAGDQTKDAIDTGTFTLTLPRGAQGLIWANGNCDLFAGSH